MRCWRRGWDGAGSGWTWWDCAALDVLAESGPDMTRFPAPAHVVSWTGRSRYHQSGQRRVTGKGEKGSRSARLPEAGQRPAAARDARRASPSSSASTFLWRAKSPGRGAVRAAWWPAEAG
jgi:hypothetical protein